MASSPLHPHPSPGSASKAKPTPGTTPPVSKKLKDAVKFFTDPASDPKVRNNIKLSLSLEAIVAESRKDGLSRTHIKQLANVAASGKFANTTSTRLIKCLLPCEGVPQEAAVQCISWMCTNKPSHDMQALLLKWIVLTFDLLDGTDDLHALYGIIFFFLENDTMCPHACHLLYLLTRRGDVTSHRVRKLLSIQRRAGSQPYITGLLSVYKVFAPHLVSLSLPSTQRAYFRHTDRPWLAEIDKARTRVQERMEGDAIRLQREATHRTITNNGMVRKRRRLNPVPDLRSASFIHDPRAEVVTQVPLEQIKSFDEFLTNFDRLELPSQAAAVLRSPVLQHLIVCRRDQLTIHRLNFWLSQKLQTELLDSESNNPRTEQLLQLLINFTDFIQESVPVCEQFLTRYLLTWNGQDYRPYILRLVSRFRIYPFAVLNDLVLEPLRSLFFSSSVYFRCQVVHTLTELLRNYADHEVSRYREAARRQREREQEAVVRGEKEVEEPQADGLSVFSSKVDYFDPLDTVKRLTQLVDVMCGVALQMDRGHSLFNHHTMAFYELVSRLYTKYDLVFAQLPCPAVWYRAALGHDPLACSRLCRIVCNYKEELTTLKAKQDEHQQSHKKSITALNAIILTLCNSLWRNKAFDPSADHGVTMETMQTTGVPRPDEIFSLQGGLANVCFCKKFFEETQRADKCVEPRMIKSSHKSVYLDFLRRERMEGVVEFVETFIRRSRAGTTTINKSGLQTTQDEMG